MPEELGGVKILIDPGHGGIGRWRFINDVVERDITLSISHELRKRLEKKGATVIMTRTERWRCIGRTCTR